MGNGFPPTFGQKTTSDSSDWVYQDSHVGYSKSVVKSVGRIISVLTRVVETRRPQSPHEALQCRERSLEMYLCKMSKTKAPT